MKCHHIFLSNPSIHSHHNWWSMLIRMYHQISANIIRYSHEIQSYNFVWIQSYITIDHLCWSALIIYSTHISSDSLMKSQHRLRSNLTRIVDELWIIYCHQVSWCFPFKSSICLMKVAYVFSSVYANHVW